MALVNEQAASEGNPPLGFINPALYSFATGPGYGVGFHDISSGTSGSYSAVPGYDLVSGWGSPNGTGLINALASAPTMPDFTISASPASMSVPRGSLGTSTITATASGGFQLDNCAVGSERAGRYNGGVPTRVDRSSRGRFLDRDYGSRAKHSDRHLHDYNNRIQRGHFAHHHGLSESNALRTAGAVANSGFRRIHLTTTCRIDVSTYPARGREQARKIERRVFKQFFSSQPATGYHSSATCGNQDRQVLPGNRRHPYSPIDRSFSSLPHERIGKATSAFV